MSPARIVGPCLSSTGSLHRPGLNSQCRFSSRLCNTAGCLHPDHQGFFASPAQYMSWYSKHGPLGSDPTHPTVAVLLYRKHVITEQLYIGQLISSMEAQGVRPIPIFINGIEAHTVVGLLFASLCRGCSPSASQALHPAISRAFDHKAGYHARLVVYSQHLHRQHTQLPAHPLTLLMSRHVNYNAEPSNAQNKVLISGHLLGIHLAYALALCTCSAFVSLLFLAA